MDVDKTLQECEHNDFDIYARRDISISSVYVQFDLKKKWISLLDSDSYSSRVSSVCPRDHTMFTPVICCTFTCLDDF